MTAGQYRELGGIATAARILLYAQAALAAAAAAIAASGSIRTDAYAVIGGLQFLLLLAGGICVLRWVYFAYANVHATGAEGLSSTPGWAVGFYFVPFANLIMPFKVMQESWKASIDPRDWEAVASPSIIGWWWACWLLYNVLSNIGFALDMDSAEGAPTVRSIGYMYAVGDVANVAASLLLASIIARVTSRQRSLAPVAIFS